MKRLSREISSTSSMFSNIIERMGELVGALSPAEVLSGLVGVDPVGLDRQGLLDLIAEFEQIRSYVQAAQNDVFVAYERLTTPVVGNSFEGESNLRWAAAELGLVLGVSRHQAWHRVTQAVTLAEKLPQTAAAMRAGRIGVLHAATAADRAHNLTVGVAQEVEAAVMAEEGWRTPSQLEKAFAAHVCRVDPDGAAHRARSARRDRGVRLRPAADGMATLSVYTTADDAQAVNARVDALARSSQATNTPGDHRTLSERRVDVLVDLVCGDPGTSGADADGPSGGDRSTASMTPTRHGRAPQIHVVVSWSTLVGLDDLPADLTGYGPVDAATGRRLAADPNSVWRRLLVDPLSGRLMDYGTTTYRPPQDLQDFVIARDGLCRFPGCDVPAVACDLDHRQPYGIHGGATDSDNTDPLCRHHQRLKHEGGWTHDRDPDTGESVWTTLDGNRYGRPAHVLPHGRPVEPPEPSDPGPPPF